MQFEMFIFANLILLSIVLVLYQMKNVKKEKQVPNKTEPHKKCKVKEIKLKYDFNNDSITLIKRYLVLKDEISRIENSLDRLSYNVLPIRKIFVELYKDILKEYDFFLKNIKFLSNTNKIEIEIDVHGMRVAEIKKFFPKLIDLLSVFGSDITVIHGHNKGTKLKKYIESCEKNENVYYIYREYQNNKGRTFLKIKLNEDNVNKYKYNIDNLNLAYKENMSYEIAKVKELYLKNHEEMDDILTNLKISYSIDENGIKVYLQEMMQHEQKRQEQVRKEQLENEKIRQAEIMQEKIKKEHIKREQIKMEQKMQEKLKRERIERVTKRNEKTYEIFKERFDNLSTGDILVHKALGKMRVDKVENNIIYATNFKNMVKHQLAYDISIVLYLKDIERR